MMTLVMISLLAGMVLGQRFKVLVLVPAIAFGLVLTICAGTMNADAVWSIVLMSAATTASLQIGYFAGIGIRHLMVATRANRLRVVTGTASRPLI